MFLFVKIGFENSEGVCLRISLNGTTEVVVENEEEEEAPFTYIFIVPFIPYLVLYAKSVTSPQTNRHTNKTDENKYRGNIFWTRVLLSLSTVYIS